MAEVEISVPNLCQAPGDHGAYLLSDVAYEAVLNADFEITRFLPPLSEGEGGAMCRIRGGGWRIAYRVEETLSAEEFLVTPTEIEALRRAANQFVGAAFQGEPQGPISLRRNLLFPDPRRYPECYRLTNDQEDPRLVILWGMHFGEDMIRLPAVVEILERFYQLPAAEVQKRAWKWLRWKRATTQAAAWRLGDYLADDLRTETEIDKKGREREVRVFSFTASNDSLRWDRTVRLRKYQMPATHLTRFRSACRDFYAQADVLGREKPFVREMIRSLRFPDPLRQGRHAECYRWRGRGWRGMPLAGRLHVLPEWELGGGKKRSAGAAENEMSADDPAVEATRPDLQHSLHPARCRALALPPRPPQTEEGGESPGEQASAGRWVYSPGVTVDERLDELDVSYKALAVISGSCLLLFAILAWFIFAGLMDHESPLITERVETEVADTVVLRFSEPVLFAGEPVLPVGAEEEEAAFPALALYHASGGSVPVDDVAVTEGGRELTLKLAEALFYYDEVFAVFSGVTDRAFLRNPLLVREEDVWPERPGFFRRIFGKRISRAERALGEREASLERLPAALHARWEALPEEMPAAVVRVDYIDVLPPGIASIEVPPVGEEDRITVRFDEPVTADSVRPGNFAVTAAVTPPLPVEAGGWEDAVAADPLADSEAPDLITGARLRFAKGTLERSGEYDLLLRGVRDLAGNVVEENREADDPKRNPRRFLHQDTTRPELLGDPDKAVVVRDPWTLRVFFNKAVALPEDRRWQGTVFLVEGDDPVRRRVIGLDAVRVPDDLSEGEGALELTLADRDFLRGPNLTGPSYRLELPPVPDLTGNLSESLVIGPFTSPHENDQTPPDLENRADRTLRSFEIQEERSQLRFHLNKAAGLTTENRTVFTLTPVPGRDEEDVAERDSVHPESVSIESDEAGTYALLLTFTDPLRAAREYRFEVEAGTLVDRPGNRSEEIKLTFEVPGADVDQGRPPWEMGTGYEPGQ